MKRLIALLLLCAMTAGLRAEGEGWLTDFAAAKKQAKAENKPLVMLFTGSDWCSWCVKWNKEVFSQADFQDYAKKNLVLLMVDFPQKKELPKAQQRANDNLQSKYKIEMYPTIVALNPEGKKLGSISYTEGGTTAFVKKLDELKK